MSEPGAPGSSLRPDGPFVVAVGGGHGLSMVLQAVRNYAHSIAGVVTVADDGGSSGRLTSRIDIPPPGDMRRCLLALCPQDTPLTQLFAHRFENTDVAGHSMGNLMLAALFQIHGDFETALEVAGTMLGAVGRIIPVAPTSLHLSAMIEGEHVDGQAEIARRRGRIEKMQLTPEVGANPHALEAIAGADQIILGPGSLYTSVLSCLLVPGLVDALNAAPGRLVYVLNLTTQDGETLGMSGVDHLDTLLRMSGLSRQGTVLVNRRPFAVPPPVEPVTLTEDDAATFGWRVAAADVVDLTGSWPHHDVEALSCALAGLTQG